MKENQLNITFAEKFKIEPSEYESLSITTLSFSVRTINRFMANDITTVSMLLKSSPATLLKIKGFGQNCLDEIYSFCSTLSANFKCTELLVEEEKKISTVYSTFATNKNEIATGNFSAFDNCDLSSEEIEALQNYKEAYFTLGDELVFDCFYAPQRVVTIIDMFSDYQNRIGKRKEIWDLIEALPDTRKNNKALGYINAFTLDETERSLLIGLCSNNNDSLLSLGNTPKIDETTIHSLLKKFLRWCSFDLSKELDEMFSTIYSNEKTRTIIQMRARKQTLEQIGISLGVTRERIRQIEAKAKRRFSHLQSRLRILSKISAERNGDTILSASEIDEFCGVHTSDLIFFLQSHESASYTYDRQLDLFIIGDDSIKGRVQNCLDSLPTIIKSSQLESVLYEASEEKDIPFEMLQKAFLDAYRLTGEVYHRHRLSLASIFERVLEAYYPTEFKAYDPNEIYNFRKIVEAEYGEVGLPESDYALTSRITKICVLCNKGTYRLKRNDFISRQLANKICDYIENSDNTIFLTNTLFSVFEEDLLKEGVNNKYFLQGVLHELFADKFIFRRDYISKDIDVTSVYSSVVDFIKKHDYPVSKAQIYEAFPGITEIVINFSVGDPNVLNFFGEYLHTSKLKILDSEKSYLFDQVYKLVSDKEPHHIRELYDIITNDKPEILTRNAAMYPFSTYSLVEFLFRNEFQFSRPYVAKIGVEIGRPAERLHDLIYSSDEFTVSEICEFSKENRFQIVSLLDYINSCNDKYLLVDNNSIMNIKKTGINDEIAKKVENIIFNAVSETIPIRNLSVWSELPVINVPWTEWLIYSLLFKWSTKLLVSTSSNQFKLSVPLVSHIDNYDSSAFKGFEKGEKSEPFFADDLSDLDSLIEEFIDSDFSL